jgi:hypothetical protein
MMREREFVARFKYTPKDVLVELFNYLVPRVALSTVVMGPGSALNLDNASRCQEFACPGRPAEGLSACARRRAPRSHPALRPNPLKPRLLLIAQVEVKIIHRVAHASDRLAHRFQPRLGGGEAGGWGEGVLGRAGA